jgi:hypothetical protein
MQINHHLDEVQTYARSDDPGYVTATMIALKQSIEIARGNTDSVICDGDYDLCVPR